MDVLHGRDNRPGNSALGWPGRSSRVLAPCREPLQAGSSLSPQIPSESIVHAVFERDPEILHVLNLPLPSPLRNYWAFIYKYVYFRPDIVRLSWGRRSVDLLPVAQRTIALTNGVVDRPWVVGREFESHVHHDNAF